MHANCCSNHVQHGHLYDASQLSRAVAVLHGATRRSQVWFCVFRSSSHPINACAAQRERLPSISRLWDRKSPAFTVAATKSATELSSAMTQHALFLTCTELLHITAAPLLASCPSLSMACASSSPSACLYACCLSCFAVLSFVSCP
jgi:hypothetical protein